VILALSTAQKLGLAAVAGLFIIFALLSAFVLPSRNPNYPGKRLGAFIAVSALFVVAMLTTITVLARETEEAEGHEGTQATETATTETQTQPTETQGTETQATETQPAPQVEGDPNAGKAIFTSAGCNGCHTLAAANATGQVGPNLDELKPDYDAIVAQVENGGGGMPPFQGQLSDDEIKNVAAFVFVSTHQG
jgi:mono/diheme cytochrome c family protein